MPIGYLLLRRGFIVANLSHFALTARTKGTPLGGFHDAGQVSFQHDFALFDFRIGNGHSG